MNVIVMIPKNEKGIALIVSILFLTLICLLGLAGIFTSTTDIKIATNSLSNAKTFHIAEAGINHAIFRLGFINASSGNPYNFSDELATAASIDGLLGSYVNPGDDNPLVSLSFGDGSYVVYLHNDSSQGRTAITDNNMRATLTSIGSGPGKSE
ncbi:MAG: pilus assembly PilX N-terminal domain-containing protein, partial [Thermodesulfobacteriota bacterium]|nr:pilus assembly PilX N-terminal domain-containing protein [Thermodesulfobacteriota bacterium]